VKDWWEYLRDQYILIELTDYCNFNCIMCAHDYLPGPHYVPRGFMEFELFKRLLFELKPRENPVAIKLFWLGESLLHPEILKILFTLNKFFKKKSGYYLDLHTNGSFLDKETISIFLKFKERFPVLTISLDAVQPQTYIKIRRGGDVNKVLKNIELFIKMREKNGYEFPSLNIQFIAMEENRDEILEFVNYFKKLITSCVKYERKRPDTVYIKMLDLHHNMMLETAVSFLKQVVNKLMPVLDNLNCPGIFKVELMNPPLLNANKPKTEKSLKQEGISICSAPFKTPCISKDGQVTICCFDSKLQLSAGNLNKNSFYEIWFSNEMNQIRRLQLTGNRDKIKSNLNVYRCSYCPGLSVPFLYEDELFYLKKVFNIYE